MTASFNQHVHQQEVTSGQNMSFNITSAAVVKAGNVRICKVFVLVAGSGAGTVNDSATTGAAAVANQIAAIPNSLGILTIDVPCVNGLVIVPGTGMTVAVSYT